MQIVFCGVHEGKKKNHPATYKSPVHLLYCADAFIHLWVAGMKELLVKINIVGLYI